MEMWIFCDGGEKNAGLGEWVSKSFHVHDACSLAFSLHNTDDDQNSEKHDLVCASFPWICPCEAIVPGAYSEVVSQARETHCLETCGGAFSPLQD